MSLLYFTGGVIVLADRLLEGGAGMVEGSQIAAVHTTAMPAPLEVVRMASLTPARIAGCEHTLGSIAAGKRADLVVLTEELEVRQVFVAGQPLTC